MLKLLRRFGLWTFQINFVIQYKNKKLLNLQKENTEHCGRCTMLTLQFVAE
jgi:hypothetical protein